MKPRFIFDAGPLITLCKYQVNGRAIIDVLLEVCGIVIPEAVQSEVVVAGSRYADAKIAQARLLDGRIQAVKLTDNSSLIPILDLYGFGDGEKQSMLLAVELRDVDGIVVDDHLAYLVCDRLGLKKTFLLDLVVKLCKDNLLSIEVGKEIVLAVAARYPVAFVQHTLLLLTK